MSMRWLNLKKNRCPKCSKDMALTATRDENRKLTICTCGFSITDQRFNEIVSGTVSKELNRQYFGIDPALEGAERTVRSLL